MVSDFSKATAVIIIRVLAEFRSSERVSQSTDHRDLSNRHIISYSPVLHEQQQ